MCKDISKLVTNSGSRKTSHSIVDIYYFFLFVMSLLFLHDDDMDDGDDEIEGNDNDGGAAMSSIWILVLFEIKDIFITLNQ